MTIHIIDCSVQPMIPDGWRINPKDQIASRVSGELIWTPEQIRLHLDPAQEGDGVLKGDALQKKLDGQRVMPANVLDYLLANPALIPPDWKEQTVSFWGTVYSGGECKLVRSLTHFNGYFWTFGFVDRSWRNTRLTTATLAR